MKPLLLVWTVVVSVLVILVSGQKYDAGGSAPSVQFLHQAITLQANQVDVIFTNEQGQNQTAVFSSVGYGELTSFRALPASLIASSPSLRFLVSLRDSKTNATVANLGNLPFPLDSKQSLFSYSRCNDPTVMTEPIMNCTAGYFVAAALVPVNDTQPKEFGVDVAKVKVINLSTRYPILELWGVDTNCYKCLNLPLAEIDQGSWNYDLILETHHSFHMEAQIPRNLSFPFTNFTKDFATWQLRSYRESGFFTKLLAFEYLFGEYGVYTILIVDDLNAPGAAIVHRMITVEDPQNAFIPIYVALGILAGVFIVWFVLSTIYEKVVTKRWHIVHVTKDNEGKAQYNFMVRKDDEDFLLEEEKEQSGADKNKNKPATRTGAERVNALDALRGFAIVIMIFVNYGGGSYWFFNHAKWYGLTVADLVFPWFIWIMGTSMAMSFDSLEKKGTPLMDTLYKLIRRSVILFGLGLFLINGGYDYKHWRIPGVLQRFSVSYLVVGLILLFVPKWKWHWFPSCGLLRVPQKGGFTVLGLHSESETDWDWDGSINHKLPSAGGLRRRTSEYSSLLNGGNVRHPEDAGLDGAGADAGEGDAPSGFLYDWLRDIVPYWLQWIAALMVLATWFLLTFFLDVPGCPNGYLGPGGISEYGKYENCTGGAAGYIDEKVFGADHIYTTPTAQELYLTGSYDPEGLLGCLTSIFLVFLGVQSGRILVAYKSGPGRIVRWLAWGFLCGGIAMGLCGVTKFDGFMPLAKNLWSASFILATGGGAFILLALFYLLIDALKIWNGSPFRFVGMNPILIYCGHEVLGGYMPFSFQIYDYATHTILLAMNLVGVTCWCFIAYYMYWNRFFIAI